MRKLFTSESVTEGHPDKMADQISDAILDAMIQGDPASRVACETFVTTGVVFVAGTSTGGSDILVRLLKPKYRNVPIGQITMCFDAVVVVLTGLVFRDVTKALYTGVTVFICGKVIDAVVYRFDYSKVALIISGEHERIARQIGVKLDRGATFLHGEGSYSGQQTKVILTAVKKQQLAELKELVTGIDPNAFIIVQEAHQVMGEGFSRYSRDSL